MKVYQVCHRDSWSLICKGVFMNQILTPLGQLTRSFDHLYGDQVEKQQNHQSLFYFNYSIKDANNSLKTLNLCITHFHTFFNKIGECVAVIFAIHLIVYILAQWWMFHKVFHRSFDREWKKLKIQPLIERRQPLSQTCFVSCCAYNQCKYIKNRQTSGVLISWCVPNITKTNIFTPILPR